jgi:hypothetical protein
MEQLPEIKLTKHARDRMDSRRISMDAVRSCWEFGRIVHVLGATYHVIGRREIERWRRRGINLDQFGGIHVVCARDGSVMTVYRTGNLRLLHPRRRQRSRRWGFRTRVR